jgi:hypothetical protein
MHLHIYACNGGVGGGYVQGESIYMHAIGREYIYSNRESMFICIYIYMHAIGREYIYSNRDSMYMHLHIYAFTYICIYIYMHI